MAANDFITLTNLINKFGLSGGGSNRFVTKNDLIDYKCFNQVLFNKYRAGEFIPEKDIEKYQQINLTKPAFLVDLNNTANTVNSLYNEINGLRLTPRSGTPNVTITTKDGFRCLKSNARGNQNVYQIAYSSVPTSLKNALLSGNFTVVTFLALPASESSRWGVSCFYDKSQLTSGWMTDDFKPFTNIMTAKWNLGHFAFDSSGDKTKIGMMAYAVDRTSSKKIRHTNQPSTVYSPNLNITEIAFTGDVTSGNGMSQIGGSEYLQIGKAQESSYFMSTGCYFQALAIYTTALSKTELEKIYKYKSLKSNYKNIDIYKSGEFITTAQQLPLTNSINYNEEFDFIYFANALPANINGGSISTIFFCCDNSNNVSIEYYFDHSENIFKFDIYDISGTKTTLVLDDTIIGCSFVIKNGTLEISNTNITKSHKLYNYIKPITKFYFMMNPNYSNRTCKLGTMGGIVQINQQLKI